MQYLVACFFYAQAVAFIIYSMIMGESGGEVEKRIIMR
jgi:hypothetical protein